MHIILRKIGGRFDAFFRSGGGLTRASRGASASLDATLPRGFVDFLLSPLVLVVLALAFLAMWHLAQPLTLAHSLALPMIAGSVNLRELRTKRATLATELRAMTDTAEKEKRNLSPEEEVRYGKLFGEIDEHRKTIEREEQLVELERSLAASTPPAPALPGAPGTPEVRTTPRGTEEYRNAFAAFLCKGFRGMSPDEQRALSVGSDTAGGFTTAAEQFVQGLIKAVDNILWIRQLATKLPVPTAQSLGVMTLDSDPDDADWTSELATGAEDGGMAFGKRRMIPHPIAKRLKVSNDFLRQTLSGGEALVRDRLAYKFGVTQEKGFMIGSGVQQALGIFTVSNDGIPATRDVSAGNTAVSPTFDGLMAAKYALKQQYWTDKLRWVFHRDAVLKIAQLKDLQGQYLWRESVRAGEPDRILNFGLAMSEYVPNVFTTGLYVGALGEWSNYWIADAYDLAIKRLDELYAETNQTGFIGRAAVDGQPVLAEAFVRVKLG